MTTATSRTFRTDQGQAVTLPPEVAYDDGVELTLERSGEVLTIRPAKSARRFSSGRELVEALRNLPPLTHGWPRDDEPLPERDGL